MINGWQSHYHLKPVFDGNFDYYKITFPTTTTKTTGKTTEETTGKNKENEIVKILDSNPHLTLKEVADLVSLTEEGVRYHIRNLKKIGKIKREGQIETKAHWEGVSNLYKELLNAIKLRC